MATLIATVLCVGGMTFVPAASGSSIVFAGIDAEDGGPNGHGPIANYCQLVNSMLGDVDGTAATKNGIIVLGSKGFGSVSAFWSTIAGCVSEPVTQIGTAQGITDADLTQYQMIAVVSSAAEAGGGLDQDEQDALLARADDITASVNSGGALLGFSQTGLSNPYQYVGGVGSLSVNTGLGYSDITPTPAGTDRGITDALDVCCWHDSFNNVPSGYQVLAFEGTSNDAAAIGTGSSVATEICNNGVDDDGDGDVDGDDSDCQVVVPENCSNGVDDDGDGKVDGDDPDCQATEGPPGDPNCSNGVDDDGDGKVDGADPDCQDAPPGTSAKCVGRAATIFRGSGYPGTNVGKDQPMTIVGTEGDDVIVTQNGADDIRGRGGDDVICSGGGKDVVQGNDGDDEVHAGNGDDIVNGGRGEDDLWGDDGNDNVFGSADDDEIRGNEDNDHVFGGSGDDTIAGGRGADDLNGDEGDDVMTGRDGNDDVSGGFGDDKVYGQGGVDHVYGRSGNDRVDGGDQDDHLFGGDDDDRLFGGNGDDHGDGGAGTDTANSVEHPSNIP